MVTSPLGAGCLCGSVRTECKRKVHKIVCPLHSGSGTTHAGTVNKLFATWHAPPDIVELGDDADVCELLAQVHDRLSGIPELGHVLELVDLALDEVMTWFDGGIVPMPVR